MDETRGHNSNARAEWMSDAENMGGMEAEWLYECVLHVTRFSGGTNETLPHVNSHTAASNFAFYEGAQLLAYIAVCLHF